jgi:hypothetical protein
LPPLASEHRVLHGGEPQQDGPVGEGAHLAKVQAAQPRQPGQVGQCLQLREAAQRQDFQAGQRFDRARVPQAPDLVDDQAAQAGASGQQAEVGWGPRRSSHSSRGSLVSSSGSMPLGKAAP